MKNDGAILPLLLKELKLPTMARLWKSIHEEAIPSSSLFCPEEPVFWVFRFLTRWLLISRFFKLAL